MILLDCTFLILTSSVLSNVALHQTNWRNFDMVKHKRLLSGSISTKSVRSALACATLCTSDQSCCSSNYEKVSSICKLETSCSPAMEQFQDSKVMIKVIKWLPVFVAYSGNEKSVYTAWRNQTECYDLPTPLAIANTTRHVRNPLIDSWSDAGIKKVKVQLVKNDVTVAWLIFNGGNTNTMNWFSKENLLNSSFNDLTTSSTTKFFGIQGDM
ncbi:Hypothetical predicted protein [Mytilus galloprovincialis]|uniref:Apple domain-containing protein n=1 Tax=Mytilus galloprovincialis TaxID=29158 RepID=A0A8B6CRL1_MYTGA|nr:Hypothetical predicted protein [Mytilus galloprovincialis]